MSNFDFMQMPPESENPMLNIPGQSELLTYIRGLYSLIEKQRTELDNQRSLLRRMSAELMLEGRWKPLEQAAEILGFPYESYAVCLYNFTPDSDIVDSEDKRVFDIKIKISDCFEAAFSPVCECCSCESNGCLGAVLLNIPTTAVTDEQLLKMLHKAVDAAKAGLGASVAASLSGRCGDIAQLPEARVEALELANIQLTLPGAATAICAGAMELYEDKWEQPTMDELAARQDVDGVVRLLYERFAAASSGELRSAAAALAVELDEAKKALGLGRQYEDISIRAGEQLRRVSRSGQAIGILMEYMDALRPALERQVQPTETEPLELPGKIRQLIDTDFTRYDMSLSYLGDALGVSENKITKAFKKAYGVGVLSYIHHLRIARAKELLLSTDAPVSEIYTLSGYTNRRTFDRVFKQYTGMTTAQFKGENKAANQ